MKKEQIFLGEVGLTSTSANHISNLAKEQYLATEQQLESVRLYNEDLKLIGEEASRLKNGWTINQLSRVPELLNEIASLKSLIAWLREGIKAKDSLLFQAKLVDLKEWAELNDIEIPEKPTDVPVEPVKEKVKSRDDIIAAMTVKERNRILQVEQIAAAYGGYIHPDEAFSDARKQFEKIINNPSTTAGQGRDTVIHVFTPSVDREEVEAMFFLLQNKHREAQAELNGINYKIDKEIEDEEIRIAGEYAAQMEEYKAQMFDWNTKLAEWNGQMSVLRAKLEEWRQEEIRRISQLKIIIPNDLREVYEKVNSLGKQ